MSKNTRAPAAKIGFSDLTRNTGPVRSVWTAQQNPGQFFQVVVGWVEVGRLCWIEVQDRQRNVSTKIFIPRSDRYFHIFLIKANAVLEVKEYSRKDDVLIRHLLVQFKETDATRQKIIDMFSTVKSLVQVMPESNVPYFNMGFKRPPPIRSGTYSGNLRQLPLPNNPNHRPWQMLFTHSGTVIKFVGGLAHTPTRKVLCWFTQGGYPAVEDAVVAVNDTNTIISGGTGGGCGNGTPPTDLANVRAKLFRREWVGCQEGANCRSDNFWYHVICTDIGPNINLKQKSRGWVCEPCRPHVSVQLKYGRYVTKY